jgi:sterol 3beta-glucosyltransferase
MVTSVNEVAAPTVAEYRNIPHFRIAYTPVLAGYQPPPLIPWQRLPKMANLGLWHVINGMTGLLIKKYINKKRRDLGLDPMIGTGRYFTDRSHTILTINSTLAPPCTTWHKKYDFSYTGYCYGDIHGNLEPGLMDFLKQGPPPVFIGFGSVIVKNPVAFTHMILEAAQMARCRVILGTGWTGLGDAELPGHAFRVGDTNHATLFPLCAGVAHHGGSGTTHTAARAGVPQFIMPQIADQFYWGRRVHALELGPAPVSPGKITSRLLGRVFSELSGNPRYLFNARALGKEMRFENGIPAAVSVITSRVNGTAELKDADLACRL